MKKKKLRSVTVLLIILMTVAGCETTCRLAGYQKMKSAPEMPSLRIDCMDPVVRNGKKYCTGGYWLDESNMTDLMLYIHDLEEGY